MVRSSSLTRRLPLALAATAAAALVAACGGGGGDSLFGGLSTDVAEGYAADGSSMSMSAASALDSGIASLEAGVAGSAAGAAAAASDQSALSASALATVLGTQTCSGGGTVQWTVDATDPSTIGNHQLDAGETYTATFNSCVGADGATLNGGLTVVVTARSATELDTTSTANNLRWTTANGDFTLNGSMTGTRTSADAGGGATAYTTHQTSSSLALTSVRSNRTATYQLTSYDWTVVRTVDANGALLSRAHQGSLTMDASTPRRPNATIAFQTQGALTQSSDGWAGAGSFVLTTSSNRITGVWGSGSITLTLDRGNDGTVDQTWTRTRADFVADAG
jgi:hypothetical protein